MAADHRAAATAALPETLLRQQATIKTKTPEATEMTTPSTEHPEFPCAPDERAPKDDRHPGVHLLKFEPGESKLTAEFHDRRYWTITEWELWGFEGGIGPHWISRFWHTLDGEHLETLARLQALELAQPPAEQGALDLSQQA